MKKRTVSAALAILLTFSLPALSAGADGCEHDYSAVVTPPTCTSKGYTTYTCALCGDSYTDDFTETEDHSFEAETVAAACTTKGYTRHICSVCGAYYDDNLSPALGHSYNSSGVCVRCGAQKLVFSDVSEDYWSYSEIDWAVCAGITNGGDNNCFLPTEGCTRAQVVTFLWRAEGEPEPSSDAAFTDVEKGSWYYDAVCWALERGITNGTSQNTFEPNLICSRGQIVTFLYRAEGEPAAGGENPFTDIKAGSYYERAALWAAEYGITEGTGGGCFSPEEPCTREQIVVFLYRAEN